MEKRPAETLWASLLIVWLIVLCFVPDPRPLAAPERFVELLQRMIRLPEPMARAGATLVLRVAGLGLIGILLSQALRRLPIRQTLPIVVIASPLLAVACQWINHGHFPVSLQLQIGVATGIGGALVGLVLRRSFTAFIILILMLAALYAWGSATKIPDDLYLAAQRTGQHVLAESGEIPPGDDGFTEIMRVAFAYADENSHQSHAVFANRAAILALGVILGDERVARVARRNLDPQRRREAAPLRRRITLRGRHDLSRHFWVSAALTVASDENRSMSVGIAKELMDATSGGTGFSFVDMAANYSGIRFAGRATRSEVSARDLQAAIGAGLTADDFCPDISGLPEGLSGDQFHSDFGGLGGKRTRELMAEIRRRLDASAGLTP